MNVSKLVLAKRISMLSRSFALVMVEAQIKATKTPHAVINPFRYGESIAVFKVPFAATIIRGEKQSRKKMYTMIRSMISLLTTSDHRNVSIWTDYRCVAIAPDNSRAPDTIKFCDPKCALVQ